MPPLSHSAMQHLRELVDWPDLSGTPYDAVDVIGRGGMAAVYRAYDRRLDRYVAIKVTSTARADDATLAGALHEARVLSRLEHPGIVPVHDCGTLPDGRVYSVMRLVQGRRLDQYALDPQTSLTSRLEAFERVCETVAFAHAAEVLHRDLKPENIMVGAFGEVLVLDWGIAKAGPVGLVDASEGEPPASGQSSPPLEGTVGKLGTPGFSAPEQLSGHGASVDVRADVYALGAILRFVTRPISSSATAGDDGPSTPAQPRALRAIIAKACAIDPADRYASVLDLAADMAHFRAQEPVRAHPERWWERGWRVGVKHRALVLLVLAYLLMRLLVLYLARR
jgi:eukaryotic-like serine/threonine-protein kinase